MSERKTLFIQHILRAHYQNAQHQQDPLKAAKLHACKILQTEIRVLKREEIRHMREQVSYIKVGIVYLTVIQESQNVVAYTINLLKMNQKFQEGN